MMNDSRSDSRRQKSQEQGAQWGQQQVGEVFGTSESVAGTAGGSRTNYSTAGDSTVNPKRTPAKSDASYYENESVMLWSDNPEKEYFTYMLQKEQENRAKQGKAEDDSLIGKSTLEEIQQEFSKWHQQGGEIDPQPGYQDPNSSFPALSSSPRIASPGRLALDGFSLATDEKSPPKQIPVQVNFPTTPSENSRSKLFPDVIYVTDTPATSVELMSRPSQDSSKSEKRNKSIAITLLIVGILCLAAAAVAIYISVSSAKDSKTSNSASSLQQGTDNQAISWGPVDGTSLRPTRLPSTSPSVINQITTSLPTETAYEEEMAAPTLPPSTASITAGTEATTSPSTVVPIETPSAASGQPSATSASPTSKPTSERPSVYPTSKPTDEQTHKPTNDPTNDSNSKVFCGCRNCGFAINRMAEGYTCGERMNFLMFERGYSEPEACRLVANTEFPEICGPFCDPDACTKPFATNLRQTPNPNTGTPSVPAEENNSYPLGLCEGVCEKDDDCATGLACFRRNTGAQVPFYCAGIEAANQADFCVLP